MLKLLAWQERGLADPRDAIDVVTLCRHYTEAGNLERVYVEALPALQAVGFDIELAGAWLLGKDTAATASPQTRLQLQALLNDARTSERLMNDMAKALRRREDVVTYVEQLLDQFTRGLCSPAMHGSRHSP